LSFRIVRRALFFFFFLTDRTTPKWIVDEVIRPATTKLPLFILFLFGSFFYVC